MGVYLGVCFESNQSKCFSGFGNWAHDLIINRNIISDRSIKDCKRCSKRCLFRCPFFKIWSTTRFSEFVFSLFPVSFLLLCHCFNVIEISCFAAHLIDLNSAFWVPTDRMFPVAFFCVIRYYVFRIRCSFAFTKQIFWQIRTKTLYLFGGVGVALAKKPFCLSIKPCCCLRCFHCFQYLFFLIFFFCSKTKVSNKLPISLRRALRCGII